MKSFMKVIDVVSFALLVIGGLNWALVGIFTFDLVAALFGTMSMLTRFIYILVGLAAIYEVAGFKFIQERWTHAPAHSA